LKYSKQVVQLLVRVSKVYTLYFIYKNKLSQFAKHKICDLVEVVHKTFVDLNI